MNQLFGRSGLTVPDEPQRWGIAGVADVHRPLVERLEQEAARNPRQYIRKVIWAATLGYVAIFGTLVALVGLGVGTIAFMISSHHANGIEIRIILVSGIVAFVLLRSLLVKMEPPEGLALQESIAPGLFDALSAVRAATAGPPIHGVLLTTDLNAAVVQNARFGMLGGNRNILLLGLPLLELLSKDEAKAVIAHEMGHFVGKHGRMTNAIYMLRRRWSQIAEQFHSGATAGILRRFFTWYGPWFAAYSFVLSRSQEYEADRVAVNATGVNHMANALIRLDLEVDTYHRYWGTVWDEAEHQAAPSIMPFENMATAFAQSSRCRDAEALDRAISLKSDLNDTHPSLADRLQAMDAGQTLPEPIETSAAVSLFGTSLETIRTDLSAKWWKDVEATWKETHHFHVQQRAEFHELAARVADGRASKVEMKRHAELAEHIEGQPAALEHYDRLLTRFPDDYGSRYRYALMLLNADEASAIDNLDRACQGWPSLRLPAAHELISYYAEHENWPEVKRIQDKLPALEEHDRKSTAEARNLPRDCHLSPPSFHAADLRKINAQLKEVAGLLSIRAAVRPLRFGDRDQLVMLAYITKGADRQAVLDHISAIMLEFADTLIFAAGSQTNWLERKLKRIPESALL